MKTLKAQEKSIKATLCSFPKDRRMVVTVHEAFGYLAHAYDLTFVAPVGIDTDAETSAKDLANLITEIQTNGATALFVENIKSPALLEQLASETRFQIGGRLSFGVLSEWGLATSYSKMFESNLSTVLTALQTDQ